MDTLLRSNSSLTAATTLQTSPLVSSSLLQTSVLTDLSAVTTRSNSSSSLPVETLQSYIDPYGDTLATAGTQLFVTKGTGTKGWQVSDAVGGADKIDTFYFDVPLTNIGGESIHVSLAGNAEVRLIKDYNGNQVFDSNEVVGYAFASGLDATIDVSGLASGRYYLQVKNEGTTAANYNLKVSYEMSNNLLGKEQIISGAKIVSGEVNNQNSSDSYYFRLDQLQKFHLSLQTLSATADFQLVRDGNNNGRIDAGEVMFDYYYQGQTNQPVTLANQYLAEGNYFLQVNQSLEYNSTSKYKIMLGCDWFSNNLSDDAILTSARAAYLGDSLISHTEMRDILRSVKDNNIIDGTEIRDLKALVSQGSALGISKATQTLANKVLGLNIANDKSGLGGFGAGSSADHLDGLIGKWFWGTDRPGIPTSIDSFKMWPVPELIRSPIAYKRAEGELFQNGISYFDIDQGEVGDCYFLASLGAVALHSPNRIANMFTDNSDGTFTVRFFVDGQENYVTVDRFLPTYDSGTFVYANNSSGMGYWDSRNELWVALAEKAYAQLNQEYISLPLPGMFGIGQDGSNTYAGISSGQAANALTHITGLNTIPNQDLSSGALFWASNTVSDMLTAFNQGRMVVVNTYEPDNADVAGKHAYILTAYNANTGEFSLYNPWKGGNLPSDRNQWGDNPFVYKKASDLLDDFHSWDATVSA